MFVFLFTRSTCYRCPIRVCILALPFPNVSRQTGSDYALQHSGLESALLMSQNDANTIAMARSQPCVDGLVLLLSSTEVWSHFRQWLCCVHAVASSSHQQSLVLFADHFVFLLIL